MAKRLLEDPGITRAFRRLNANIRRYYKSQMSKELQGPLVIAIILIAGTRAYVSFKGKILRRDTDPLEIVSMASLRSSEWTGGINPHLDWSEECSIALECFRQELQITEAVTGAQTFLAVIPQTGHGNTYMSLSDTDFSAAATLLEAVREVMKIRGQTNYE